MNTIVRVLLGLAIVLCGGLVLYNSASMSYQGYERGFPGLFGAGLIGVGISGLAFFCAGAIGVAWRMGLKDVAVIASLMAVACFAGDVYGNRLATVGEVQAKAASALEQQAAFNASSEALPVIRERIRVAASELAIVTGPEVKAAQRLLMAKGLYDGRIDGVAGGKTEEAIKGFAAKQNAALEKLGSEEASHQAIVSAGAPEAPKAHEESLALAIAFLLTILSMASSAIGLPLMVGKKMSGEEELEALEETMDEFEAEVFDFYQFVKERGTA